MFATSLDVNYADIECNCAPSSLPIVGSSFPFLANSVRSTLWVKSDGQNESHTGKVGKDWGVRLGGRNWTVSKDST